MHSRIFMQQLALERCQQNLAQLSSVLYVSQDFGLEDAGGHFRTMQGLIEILSRDLDLINSLMHTDICKNSEESSGHKKVVYNFVRDQ